MSKLLSSTVEVVVCINKISIGSFLVSQVYLTTHYGYRDVKLWELLGGLLLVRGPPLFKKIISFVVNKILFIFYLY